MFQEDASEGIFPNQGYLKKIENMMIYNPSEDKKINIKMYKNFGILFKYLAFFDLSF